MNVHVCTTLFCIELKAIFQYYSNWKLTKIPSSFFPGSIFYGISKPVKKKKMFKQIKDDFINIVSRAEGKKNDIACKEKYCQVILYDTHHLNNR